MKAVERKMTKLTSARMSNELSYIAAVRNVLPSPPSLLVLPSLSPHLVLLRSALCWTRIRRRSLRPSSSLAGARDPLTRTPSYPSCQPRT
eukprot:137581-Hanusia_phi.AAC.1